MISEASSATKKEWDENLQRKKLALLDDDKECYLLWQIVMAELKSDKYLQKF